MVCLPTERACVGTVEYVVLKCNAVESALHLFRAGFALDLNQVVGASHGSVALFGNHLPLLLGPSRTAATTCCELLGTLEAVVVAALWHNRIDAYNLANRTHVVCKCFALVDILIARVRNGKSPLQN